MMIRRVLAGAIALPAILLTSGAVRADVELPPQDCGGGPCLTPLVDGVIHPLEYADGISFPIQDYEQGLPEGTLRLVLSGDVLYIGLRVSRPARSARKATRSSP